MCQGRVTADEPVNLGAASPPSPNHDVRMRLSGVGV